MPPLFPFFLSACLAPTSASDTGTPAPTAPISSDTAPLETGLAAICDGVWPPATCAHGCPDPDEQVWADGAMRHLATGWGMTEAELAPLVHVRSVSLDGVESFTQIHLQADLGWASFVWTHNVWGTPQTVDEAADGMRGSGFPDFDPRAPVVPQEEAQAFVVDCGDEHDVVFLETSWCDVWVDLDPDPPHSVHVQAEIDTDGDCFTDNPQFRIDLFDPADRTCGSYPSCWE